MAAANLDLDLTGKSASNLFTSEARLVNLSVDRSVWPANYPFFFNDGKFAVQGRVGTGAWINLFESVHYVYSPMFTEYAISTGKEIASYIVMNDTSFTEIRFTYQALGKYTDNTLLNEIVALTNAGKLDRKSLISWQRVKGTSPNYAPTQDPNVVGKSHEEIIWLQLTRILNAMNNPNSVTAILPSDITALELKIGGKVSADDVRNIIGGVTTPTKAANANQQSELYRVPSTTSAIRGVVHITLDGATNVNVITFSAFRPDNSSPWVVIEDPGYNSPLSTVLSIVQSGSEWSLLAQTVQPVKYQFKLISQFEKV